MDSCRTQIENQIVLLPTDRWTTVLKYLLVEQMNLHTKKNKASTKVNSTREIQVPKC